MVSNPFLSIPQVESPQSRSWAMGFAFGFQGHEQSTLTPAEIQPEDADAFDQGVLGGQNAAINGVPLANACVDLHSEGPDFVHFAAEGAIDGGMFLFGVIKHGFKLAGGLAEGILSVVVLSTSLTTFTDDPEGAIAEEAGVLQRSLQRVGIESPMELFMGGAVDTADTGCELKLTAIFRSLDAAREAAKALGRARWLVVSWRSNVSSGMNVVAKSE